MLLRNTSFADACNNKENDRNTSQAISWSQNQQTRTRKYRVRAFITISKQSDLVWNLYSSKFRFPSTLCSLWVVFCVGVHILWMPMRWYNRPFHRTTRNESLARYTTSWGSSWYWRSVVWVTGNLFPYSQMAHWSAFRYPRRLTTAGESRMRSRTKKNLNKGPCLFCFVYSFQQKSHICVVVTSHVRENKTTGQTRQTKTGPISKLERHFHKAGCFKWLAGFDQCLGTTAVWER